MTSQSVINNWIEDEHKSSNPDDLKFKLNDIKIFASDNYNNAHLFPDYRTVFEKSELTYLCVHIAFTNKWFNQQSFFSKKNWHAKVLLRCTKQTANGWVDICSFDMSREILPTEKVIELKNGWGNKDRGKFWDAGKYCWDVWINDLRMVYQFFYINDVGMLNYKQNDYFKEIILRFYDSQKQFDGRSFKRFDKRKTVDIGVNFGLELVQFNSFYTEYFIEIYKGDRLLETTRSGAEYISDLDRKLDEYLTCSFNRSRFNHPGQLEAGFYTFKIKFLNIVLHAATIEIADKDFEEGEFTSAAGNKQQSQPVHENKDISQQKISSLPYAQNAKTTDDYLRELDALIGMDNIKKSIRDHIKYLKFLQLRKQKGFDDSAPILLHSVFTGNPGTGKTTIVKMLGNIYKSMGLLSQGHVKNADRADLIGEHIGQTAPKTKKAIEEARGGILFMDEAYAIANKDLSSNDFGHEAIAVLLSEMTSDAGDLAVICAGYPKEMNEFLESNPGLKSRFAHYYHFEDYTPAELLAIAEFSAKKNSVRLAEEAKTILLYQFTNAYRDRDKNFGNARFVNSVITEAKMNLGKRMMNHADISTLTDEELSTIEPVDIEELFAPKDKKQYQLGIDEQLLKESLNELNALIGIENIKQEVNELTQLIRFYIETGKDFLGKFSLHSVFTGNPGTGKTTVAKIVSKIYKALGLLERGHLVVAERQNLVGQHIGETAIITTNKVNDALGGILFIDEAYSLTPKDSPRDFGAEAIQVILTSMENLRGKFGVIVAGYTENMNDFMDSNPGLRSRFDNTFHFNDYKPDELLHIALNQIKKDDYSIEESAVDYLKNYFQYLYDSRNKNFGNARDIRKIIAGVIKKQNLRMASLSPEKRSQQNMQMVALEDVEKFMANN